MNNTQVGVSNSAAMNNTLKQVYKLLSMNMIGASIAAFICMNAGISFMTALMMSIGALVLLFIIGRKANSASGIFLTFAFTGLLGGSLGPMLNHYVSANGGEIVFQAFAITAIVFFGLSAYTISRPEKDFSKMGSFLFIGLIIAIVAMIANIFMQIPALSLALSAVVAMLMSGYIVYDTNNIIRNQPNYILATVSLYLNIHNLFTSILHLLGAFSSDD